MNNGFNFAILGSGSRGNCSVIQIESFLYLVDCGLSLRQTRLRMETLGLKMEDVQGIFLTHLDRDHFNTSWVGQVKRQRIRVHAGPMHITGAAKAGLPEWCLHPVHEDMRLMHEELAVQRVDVAHDEAGCSSFIFQANDCRLGWATDIGHVPSHLLDAFIELDAIAFESNYDRRMQEQSDRPAFLKQRIMGGQGHLSNREALEAVTSVSDRSRLQHIAMLHLSQQCNDPDRLLRLWQDEAPQLHERLVLSRQNTPTDLLRIQPATTELLTG
ncbi:MAG: MBL fold metallo-hydrolase [Phycisphaerales bacterium]|nr:MBL fold metallo-hydrolase [Phycisphaerales bacterium]